METKEEILKMNAEELINYKWNDNLDKEVNINCRDCRDCIYCIYCRNLKHKNYCICNVQLTKDEYEKKIKELEEQK